MLDYVNELLNDNVPVGINTHTPQELTQDFGSWMLVKKPARKRPLKIDKASSHRSPDEAGKAVSEGKKMPVQPVNPNSVMDAKMDTGSRFEIFAKEAENENILERAVNLDDQDSRNFGNILDENCQISTNPIFDIPNLDDPSPNPLQIPS